MRSDGGLNAATRKKYVRCNRPARKLIYPLKQKFIIRRFQRKPCLNPETSRREKMIKKMRKEKGIKQRKNDREFAHKEDKNRAKILSSHLTLTHRMARVNFKILPDVINQKGSRCLTLSSTLSLTSAVDGDWWLTLRSCRFTPGNEPVHIV